MKTRKRLLALSLLALMLAALLAPALSSSAKVIVGAQYPLKNPNLITDKSLTYYNEGTVGPAPDYPRVGMTVFDPTTEWGKPIIDKVAMMSSNPASYMKNPPFVAGEMRRSSELLFVDMWVFRVDYTDIAGKNVVLNPWSYPGEYQAETGQPFPGWSERSVMLQLDFKDGDYDMENFGLRATSIRPMHDDWSIHPRGIHLKDEFIPGTYPANEWNPGGVSWWNRNEAGTDWKDHSHTLANGTVCTKPYISVGPKDSPMYRNIDNGWWQFTDSGEDTSEDIVSDLALGGYTNTDDKTIRWNLRQPFIYVLYYFDSEGFRDEYGAEPPAYHWVPGNPNGNPEGHQYPGAYPQPGTEEYLADLIGHTSEPPQPSPTGTVEKNCGKVVNDGLGNVNIQDILFIRDVIFGVKEMPDYAFANLGIQKGAPISITQILFIRDVIFGVDKCG
ncbi:MAG: hypothetical protein FWD16_03650 [Clostridia bacterium]|nr:hypothetical protein [Clostridia bacterium]